MWPSDFVQKDTLPELVGKHEDEVLEKLGPPTYVLRTKDSISYLYEKLEEDTFIGVILYIPVVFSRHATEISCVLLNFDKYGALRGYEIESSGAARGGGYWSADDCTDHFSLSRGEAVNWLETAEGQQWAENVDIEVLFQYYAKTQLSEEQLSEEQLSEAQLSEVQLQLYYDPNVPKRLSWLCRAADHGHPEARYRLGLLYENGSENLPQNRVKAQYWYLLAAKSQHHWGAVNAQRLAEGSTPAELAEVERLIEAWQPGQCEADLALYIFKERAARGDPNAQWKLYKLNKYHGEYDFKWLCKAAEQGDYRARWELGYLYHYGVYGVRKDLVLSVMWYSLVEADGHDPKGVDNIREQLTPEQLTEAEHLYDNWIPGQCERDLVPDNPRN
jgi:TPR repeat protein